MPRIDAKIFIDGGEPAETKTANEIFLRKFGRPLDGQTTNPTLIAKNLKSRMENNIIPLENNVIPGLTRDPSRIQDSNGIADQVRNDKLRLTPNLALAEYQRIVQEMSKIIPSGSISIQVFANGETKAEEMLVQARVRNKWIPNASIKFPCTTQGLKAATQACGEFPINITLVFSQSQAAAVYEATKNAKYPVFISPFVGRLDDRGENGMDVVKNILKMYTEGLALRRSRRVEVLTASVRNLDHIFYALELKSSIITIPFKVFKNWADLGFPEQPEDTPEESGMYVYPATNLKPIPYREDIILGKPWQSYDLYHELTEKGVASFWNDWNGLF